jgi:hypothetical protein
MSYRLAKMPTMTDSITNCEFFVMETGAELAIAVDVQHVQDYMADAWGKPWIVYGCVNGTAISTTKIAVKTARGMQIALGKIPALPGHAKLEHGDIVVDHKGRIYQYDADSPEFGNYTVPITDECGFPMETNQLTCEDVDILYDLQQFNTVGFNMVVAAIKN